MFLIGTILRIYGSKHRKYWFSHCLQLLHNHGLYWNKTLIFEFIWTFLIRSIGYRYFVQSYFIFLRTYTKSSKVRSRVQYPLKHGLYIHHCTSYICTVARCMIKLHVLGRITFHFFETPNKWTLVLTIANMKL